MWRDVSITYQPNYMGVGLRLSNMNSNWAAKNELLTRCFSAIADLLVALQTNLSSTTSDAT